MGQSGNVTRRNDIGDILHENALGMGQFIGSKVLAPIFKDEQDGRFDKLAFGEVQTAAVNDTASDSSASNEVAHEYTTDSYTTVERRLKEFTSDRSNKKMTSFDITLDDAKLCQYYLMLNAEKRIADIIFDVSNEFASYNTAATTKWSTSATAVPVQDVQKAQKALIDQMNGMVDGAKLVGIGNWQARLDLLATADIKDRWIQGNTKTSLEDLTNVQIAQVLGLDEVHFSRIAQAGTQIWSTDQFGIYLVSDSNSLKAVPRVGNTFVWKDNSPSMWNVDTWREDDPKGQYTRVQTDSVEKLITARAGHIITGVDA
jgi:hypothetical protein